MGYKSASEANYIVSLYIDSVDMIKNTAEKNYLEMDLENASLNQDMEELISEIKSKCDELTSYIRDYSFE